MHVSLRTFTGKRNFSQLKFQSPHANSQLGHLEILDNKQAKIARY